MSTTTSVAVIGKVQEIASLAGYKTSMHPQIPDMLVCPFDMGGGRSQAVYIQPCGQTPEGQDIVCFVSPCMSFK